MSEASDLNPPTRDPETIQDYLAIIASGTDSKHAAMRELRLLRKLDIKEAAAISGVSVGTISQRETGKQWAKDINDILEYLRGIGINSADIDKHFHRAKHALMVATLNQLETAEAMEQLLQTEAKGDVHEFQALAFEVGIPKLVCTLMVKGASGDINAIKLAKEWWREWKGEDAARTNPVRDVTEPHEASRRRAITAQALAAGETEQPSTPSTDTTTGRSELPDNSANGIMRGDDVE